MKNIMVEFLDFACNTESMDQIKGGVQVIDNLAISSQVVKRVKKIDETIDTGSGSSGSICCIGNTGANTYCCVNDYMNCYNDGSWQTFWYPCD
jgi:hypothetical protein